MNALQVQSKVFDLVVGEGFDPEVAVFVLEEDYGMTIEYLLDEDGMVYIVDVVEAEQFNPVDPDLYEVVHGAYDGAHESTR